jgi:hypothetical protein
MDYEYNLDAPLTRVDKSEPEWKRLARGLTVTDEQVREIEDSVSIWNDTIFHQKLHAWIAPPNGGKTTIATAAARELVRQGFEVFYINLDAGAADLKYYQTAASNDGYSLIAPLAEGSSEEDCVQLIEALSNDNDLSAVVVFLDTLKKFVDVISKYEAKRLYKKLRAITVSGGTVVALGHTNKYKDSDGQLIYEGTGDLKSDVDIMMYLYPTKESDRLVVSTEFEKERARVKPHTFSIDEDRIVSLEGQYINVREVENQRKREEADMDTVYSIRKLLELKPLNQGTIVTECRAADIGSQKLVKRILKAYEGRYWYSDRARYNNELRYFLIN